MSTLTDDFDDNSRDTAKWNIDTLKTSADTVGVTVNESNNRVEITPPSATSGRHYAGYVSAGTYNLTNDAVFCKITPSGAYSGTQEFYLAVGPDADNGYLALFDSGVIRLRQHLAGVESNLGGSFAYSSSTHAWMRLRYDGTTVYVDTAPDTAANPPAPGDWTNQTSGARDVGINLTACKLGFGAGAYGSVTATTVYFDGFNTGASIGTAYDDNLTETAVAGDSLDPAGSTFGVPLAEAATAGDTVASSQTFVNSLAESATAADSLNGGLLLSGSLNEAVTATDGAATSMTFAPSLTESLAAADNLATQVSFAAPLAESAAAADAIASQAVFASPLAESAAAAAALMASQTLSVTLGESTAAADSVSADGTTTYSDNLTESVAAAASLAVGLVLSGMINEAATAADAVDAGTTMGQGLEEQLAAADGLASTAVLGVGIGEAAVAAAAFDATVLSTLTHQMKVLAAVKALVITALPEAALGFSADFGKPVRSGQHEIGRPSAIEEADFEFGGPIAFRRRIDIVLTAPDGAGGAVLDDMAAAIGAAIQSDRTLGGLCDWLEASPARLGSITAPGIASSNWATISVVAEYSIAGALAA